MLIYETRSQKSVQYSQSTEIGPHKLKKNFQSMNYKVLTSSTAVRSASGNSANRRVNDSTSFFFAACKILKTQHCVFRMDE